VLGKPYTVEGVAAVASGVVDRRRSALGNELQKVLERPSVRATPSSVLLLTLPW
jgi:hypothetical protein